MAALPAASASAKLIITTFLTTYGLASLGDWAWNKYLAGETTDQIMLELRQTKQYKARFPAMEAMGKAGKAMSEAEYMNYEQTVRSLVQQYGLPPGMYDTPAGIAKLLLNDVSATEASERLQVASAAAFQAPPEVRQALQENYGVTMSGLTAYYLDPDRALPLLQKQYINAQVQAASRIQGVGTTLATAERLAAQGVDFAGALAGYGRVRQMASLSSGAGELASREQTEGAAFGTAADAAVVERVARGRAAIYQAGGGLAEGQTGVTGLGSAATP